MREINSVEFTDFCGNDIEKLADELERTYDLFMPQIEAAEKDISTILNAKGTLYIAGNGGSAADAQHIAAELTGTFEDKSRKGLRAIALTVDTSALTAIANDFGYDYVFSRQLEALHNPDYPEVFLGITTSGNSPNIIKAVETAKVLGMRTIGLLGRDGGKLKGVCDIEIIAGSNSTPRIQAIHGIIYHHICKYIDVAFGENGKW